MTRDSIVTEGGGTLAEDGIVIRNRIVTGEVRLWHVDQTTGKDLKTEGDILTGSV